jgi:hypothetical protein
VGRRGLPGSGLTMSRVGWRDLELGQGQAQRHPKASPPEVGYGCEW